MGEEGINEEFKQRIQKYTPITQKNLLELFKQLPVIGTLSDKSLMHVAMRLNEFYQASERFKNDPRYDYEHMIRSYRLSPSSKDPGVIARQV